MKRFVIAAGIAAALGQSAAAQPLLGPPPTVPRPVVVLPPLPAPPDVQLPQPVQPPGPAYPVFKEGGLVSGTQGYYPYDTGAYLLGGDRGLYRYGGYYAMHFPPAPPVIAAVPYAEAVPVGPTAKPGLFPHCHPFRR